MRVDLRGRKANALGVIHGCEHVGHQGLDALVHHGDRLGHLVQARIGIAEDGKNCHGSQQNDVAIFATFAVFRRTPVQ
ncbi:hypothetical protein D3C85_1757510 [compost metagenome]